MDITNLSKLDLALVENVRAAIEEPVSLRWVYELLVSLLKEVDNCVRLDAPRQWTVDQLLTIVQNEAPTLSREQVLKVVLLVVQHTI